MIVVRRRRCFVNDFLGSDHLSSFRRFSGLEAVPGFVFSAFPFVFVALLSSLTLFPPRGGVKISAGKKRDMVHAELEIIKNKT